MKRPLLIEFFASACIIALPHLVLGQNMESAVIGSAGTTVSAAAGTLQYTVGEPMIRTVVQAATLSEGFHQTAIWEIVPVQEIADIHVSVWPNPFPEYLEVKTDRPISVILYDILGKKVMESAEVENQEMLQLAALPAGAYFLEVSDRAGRRVALYKLVHGKQ